jgi:hypothetical protein
MANKKLTLSFEAIFVDRVSQGLAKLEIDTLKVSKSVKSSLEAIQKGLLPTPTNNDQIAVAKLNEFKRLLDETKKSLDNLNSIKLLGAGKVPPEIRQQFTPGSNGVFNGAKADKERRDQIEGTKELAKQIENLLNSEKRVQAFRESIAQSNRGILTSNYLARIAKEKEIADVALREQQKVSDFLKAITSTNTAILQKNTLSRIAHEKEASLKIQEETKRVNDFTLAIDKSNKEILAKNNASRITNEKATEAAITEIKRKASLFQQAIKESDKGILTSNYLSKQARLAEIENNKFLEKFFSDLDKEVANKFKAIRDKFFKGTERI